MKDEEKTKEQLVKELSEFRHRVAQLEDSERRCKQTEKAYQEQLLETQKLQSIGILAGGIAHDFNNQLTAILGNVELSQMYVQPEDEIYKSLSKAKKACMRTRDLTERLSTLTRGWAPIKKRGPITEVVRNSANLAVKGSNCKCEVSVPDDLWMVEFDERHLTKTIQNLVLNAVEATRRGQVIKVSAENISNGTEKEEPSHPAIEGRHVKIIIQDGGIGISEENLFKIFEPYFSTKDMGTQKEMGLGLTTVNAIIKKHGGSIHVESEVGAGTTFYIYLPASEQESIGKGGVEAKVVVGSGQVGF